MDSRMQQKSRQTDTPTQKSLEIGIFLSVGFNFFFSQPIFCTFFQNFYFYFFLHISTKGPFQEEKIKKKIRIFFDLKFAA
jgi:hypothetical protein